MHMYGFVVVQPSKGDFLSPTNAYVNKKEMEMLEMQRNWKSLLNGYGFEIKYVMERFDLCNLTKEQVSEVFYNIVCRSCSI